VSILTDFLDEKGIDYRETGSHHHATQDFIQVDCPYCSEFSEKFRMGLAVNGNSANCWTCGTHKFSDILCELTKESWQVINKLIDSLRSENYLPNSSIYGYKSTGKLKIPSEVSQLLPCHEKYLKKRGFDPTLLNKLWQIQGIGLSAKLAFRIFIPIIIGGRIISWTTRSIIDEIQHRYINASKEEEVFSAKQVLYGQDYARNSVIVVEGPTDAWRLGPGTVATMSLTYTKKQILRLARYTQRVIIFDNEPDVQRRANSLCEQLSVFEGKTLRIEIDAADPGSASEKEVKLLRKFLE